MANRGRRGIEEVLGWLSAIWLALVLFNYAGAAMARKGAEPRFEGIRREIMAVAAWDPTATLRTIGSLLVVALAVAGMAGAGVPVLRLALRRTGAGWSRLPFALPAGFAVCGVALLGVGMAGLFRPAVLWTMLFVAIVPGARLSFAYFTRRRRTGRHLVNRGTKVIPVGGRWPRLLILAAVAAAGSASLGPETGVDSLMYHFARARHLLLEGRIVPQPSMMFAFPPVWESWLGLLLATGGEQAARLLSPAVFAASVWLLSSMVNRVRPGAGALAGSLYAGSTLVLAGASGSKSDIAMAWMSIAMFAAGARSGARSGLGWSIVSGGFAGVALLVKLTAAPAVLVVAALWARSGRRSFLRAGAVAAVVVLPWALHGAHVYGNPVHPAARQWSVPSPPAGAFENYAEELRSCLDGSYDSFNGRVRAIWSLAMAEGMTPLVMLVIPALFAALAGRIAGGWWVLAAFALAGIWSIGPPQPRYLLPALPLCAGAVAGWTADAARGGSGVRWRLGAVLCLAAFETARAWADPAADRMSRLAVASGTLARESYLRLRLTTYADAMLRINHDLPARARILPVGERRLFPLERRFIAVRSDDPAPWLRSAADSRDTRRLAAKIRQTGATHMLYNPLTADFLGAEFARVRPADRALTRWAAFWRDRAATVPWPPRFDLREGEFILYELRRNGSVLPPAHLPGVEGWTEDVASAAASGDRAAGLRRLGVIVRIAGDWPALELWQVMVAGPSMPASQAVERLERARRAGLSVANLHLELARAARRAGRKDLAARQARLFRDRQPESWLRRP